MEELLEVAVRAAQAGAAVRDAFLADRFISPFLDNVDAHSQLYSQTHALRMACKPVYST